jgi:carbon monoxide dehydrogenase subunit G
MENEFTVEAPVEQAWETLLDLERITPCLPGAALEEETDDEYKGTMTIRLGPVTQKYNGTVSFEETDEESRRAVLKADGKDARGQGTASATITSTLTEEDGGTKVHVETDMRLTGRAAQFGRGVQQEVATKLINQFAECLEKEIMGENTREEPEQPEAAEEPEEAASANDSAEEDEGEQEEKPKRRVIQQDHDVEPLDLGEASREAVLRRVIPLVAGLGALIVVIWLVRRRH